MAQLSTRNCRPLNNFRNHLDYLRRTKTLHKNFSSLVGLARWFFDAFEYGNEVDVKAADIRHLVPSGQEKPFYFACHKLHEAGLVTYRKFPVGRGFKHRLYLKKHIEQKYLEPYRQWLTASNQQRHDARIPSPDLVDSLISLVKEVSPDFDGNDYVSEVGRVIENQKDEIVFLKGQMVVKDKQLTQKDKQIASLTKHIGFLESEVVAKLTPAEQEELKPHLRLVKDE